MLLLVSCYKLWLIAEAVKRILLSFLILADKIYLFQREINSLIKKPEGIK